MGRGRLLYLGCGQTPVGPSRRPVAGRTCHRPALRCFSVQSWRRNEATTTEDLSPTSRLNPAPDDYGRQLFADKCRLKLQAGAGGHGCVSFLRDRYIPEGPPNGGDGGNGGSIFVQAVRGETSLHKIARQGTIRASRGRNGQGKSKGGQKGDDVVIQVPIGTIIREISREDPVAIEEALRRQRRSDDEEESNAIQQRNKWIAYPSATPGAVDKPPSLPRPRRSDLSVMEPEAPIYLDLSEAMEEPRLLVAGAAGGLGNPHFATRSTLRPKFATKGEIGKRLEMELELKLLADLGFVGFPNAGKSTLLRALSRSRARVGSWAFTTLQPNIGTVVLDDHHGRAKIHAVDSEGQRRANLSVADIPGIVRDAHLDHGLGLDFLRHIERARVLAFVIDLNDGDPVEVLKVLWRELDQFEKLQSAPPEPASEGDIIPWEQFGQETDPDLDPASPHLISMTETPSPATRGLELPPISTKPWFVVGTKSDLDTTQPKFEQLRQYLQDVQDGKAEHPAGPGERWQGELKVVPISAIRGHGVDVIARITANLLHGL